MPAHRDGLPAFGADGSLCGRQSDKPLEGAVAAVCAMGLCGEMAFARLSGQDGTASFGGVSHGRHFRLTPEELEKGARYEVR